jgi:hypothetical protein
VANGIIRDIEMMLAHERTRATMVLVYAGMDAMASTTVPLNRRLKRHHFIAWAEKYVRFPGPVQLPGTDLYGARCAVIHLYGSESDWSRQGECRVIHHRLGGPPIQESPDTPRHVVVDIRALVDAFLRGIERYRDEIRSNELAWTRACERLRTFNREPT